VRPDRAGRETWYGHWRANGRQVKRRIGPKRADGARDGLTRTQAEASCADSSARTAPPHGRAANASTSPSSGAATSPTPSGAGARSRRACNIESETRVHLEPFFESLAVDAIRREHVADLVAELEREGAPRHNDEGRFRNIVGTARGA
jgi:hypothetical protein